MGIPCKKCGSYYWTVSGPSGCPDCPDPWWFKLVTPVLLVVLAIAVLGIMAAYGDWAYGDWTCAFKECRVVK